MRYNIISLLLSCTCFLIVSHVCHAEWLAWASIGIFGVAIINEFHHQPANGEGITKRLNLIIEKLDEIMTKEERLAQAVADLNAGTNEIAADLQKLKDELAAGSVSEESLAALETNIAVLQQLGNNQ